MGVFGAILGGGLGAGLGTIFGNAGGGASAGALFGSWLPFKHGGRVKHYKQGGMVRSSIKIPTTPIVLLKKGGKVKKC